MTTIALLIVVACGLTWATFDAQRKLLVRDLGPVAVTALLAIAQTPLFGVWLVVEGSWHIAPGYWLPAAAVSVANLAASLLFFEALRRAPLSTIAPLLSLTPVFSAVFANLRRDER